MSDNTDEKPRSYVLAKFKEVNSVEMELILENVSPGQVLALAQILDVKAKNAFIQLENERLQREAEMQLSTPSQHIILPKG